MRDRPIGGYYIRRVYNAHTKIWNYFLEPAHQMSPANGSAGGAGSAGFIPDTSNQSSSHSNPQTNEVINKGSGLPPSPATPAGSIVETGRQNPIPLQLHINQLLDEYDYYRRVWRHERTVEVWTDIERIGGMLQELGVSVFQPAPCGPPRPDEPVYIEETTNDTSNLSNDLRLLSVIDASESRLNEGDIVGVLSVGGKLDGEIIRPARVIVFSRHL